MRIAASVVSMSALRSSCRACLGLAGRVSVSSWLSCCPSWMQRGPLNSVLAARSHSTAVLPQAWLQGMNPQTVQFLVVRIRRGHILEDALNQIAARADELKRPLRIIFSSGVVLSGPL